MSTKGGGIFVILQGRENYRSVVNSCLENGKKWGGKSRSQAGSLTCESLFSCLSNYLSLPPILHPPIPHTLPPSPSLYPPSRLQIFCMSQLLGSWGKGTEREGGTDTQLPDIQGLFFNLQN